ncbi:IS3 family transposase [Yimella sp. cx-51]|nr:IS3 family transposase [Yimella sp. cx-51]MBD2760915.1 IS3 family transposase [Yimella sp. cx-573]QTH36830.1 IS3 family transposase [Yimella sp. cx-51]
MTYPLVLDLAADGIPVAVTCGLLGFSRQAFYSWRADPVSERDLVDAYATNAAFEVHRDDPGYGYRFIADELADAGHELSERRVWKVCSQAGIVSAHSRKRGRSKKPGPPVHEDLVERDFTATGPNRLWLTDITEHPNRAGKAVPVRGQGRLVPADRGLLDRLTDDQPPRGRRARDGHRSPRPRPGARLRGPRRQGQPVPLPPLRRRAAPARAARVHGPGRVLGGQRCHGDAPISVKRSSERLQGDGRGVGRSNA